MKMMLFAIPIVALSVLSAAIGAQAPVPPKPAGIGYVSAQRIFAESTEGKAGVAKVQALQQQKAAELRTRQQTLDSTRQQAAQATDAQTRVQLQQQESIQRNDLERATAQAQTDIQALQRQVQAELLTQVKSILDTVAKEHNFQLVLNAETTIVWAAPGAGGDLTTVVIERLNAK